MLDQAVLAYNSGVIRAIQRIHGRTHTHTRPHKSLTFQRFRNYIFFWISDCYVLVHGAMIIVNHKWVLEASCMFLAVKWGFLLQPCQSCQACTHLLIYFVMFYKLDFFSQASHMNKPVSWQSNEVTANFFLFYRKTDLLALFQFSC